MAKKKIVSWQPPGKNCGLCGVKSCGEFVALLQSGERKPEMCVFYHEDWSRTNSSVVISAESKPPLGDIFGAPFDFVLDPLLGEVSARKIVMPFRPDLVEKWNIKTGDIVVGRPMSAGCPVQHVLQVIKVSKVTGVLDTWCVGPAFSRGKDVYDVEAYIMLGFEGTARVTNAIPEFGKRQRFLPGFCMMNVTHTGVVNMVLQKSHGLHVRVEDIIII